MSTDFQIPRFPPSQRSLWENTFGCELPPLDRIPRDVDLNQLTKKLFDINREIEHIKNPEKEKILQNLSNIYRSVYAKGGYIPLEIEKKLKRKLHIELVPEQPRKSLQELWKERFGVPTPSQHQVPKDFPFPDTVEKFNLWNKKLALFQEFIQKFPNAHSERYNAFMIRRMTHETDQTDSKSEEERLDKRGNEPKIWHSQVREKFIKGFIEICSQLQRYSGNYSEEQISDHLRKTIPPFDEPSPSKRPRIEIENRFPLNPSFQNEWHEIFGIYPSRYPTDLLRSQFVVLCQKIKRNSKPNPNFEQLCMTEFFDILFKMYPCSTELLRPLCEQINQKFFASRVDLKPIFDF